jgi:hypothetical protein
MRIRAQRFRFVHVVLLAVVACLTATGCPKTPVHSPLGKQVGKDLPIEALRIELYGYVDRFAGIVEFHADQIIVSSDDPEVRRNARLWKMNAIPAAQKAAFRFDPLAGYIDVWVLCKQMLQFFEEGGHGDDLFGEWQYIAIDAALMSIKDIEASFRLAAQLDDDVASPDTQRSVDEFVARHPLDNLLFVRTSTAGLLARLTKDSNRGTIAAVGRLEQSLGDLSDRMNIYATHLPDQARWQAELAIEDFLSGRELQGAFEKLDVMQVSLDRTADNVAGVSETIDGQVAGALEIVPREREAILEAVEHLRVDTLADIRAERELVLAALRAERIAVMEDVHRERVATMTDMEEVLLRVIDESKDRAEEIIDGVLWRLTILGAIALGALLAFGLFALWVFRPVRG